MEKHDHNERGSYEELAIAFFECMRDIQMLELEVRELLAFDQERIRKKRKESHSIDPDADSSSFSLSLSQLAKRMQSVTRDADLRRQLQEFARTSRNQMAHVALAKITNPDEEVDSLLALGLITECHQVACEARRLRDLVADQGRPIKGDVWFETLPG